MDASQPAPAKNSKLNLSLDLRLLVLVLLAVIAGMLVMWKPWEARVPANAQTVEVSGEATVKAEPDQFVFYPNYQIGGTDAEVALADITKRSNDIVAKLKELGVADKDIKTDASGYKSYRYLVSEPDGDTNTYNFTVTVTVTNKDLAQKVQDYLVTTSPTGSITPQPTFSTAKRKTLESQARDAATKDARAKADQSAKNLGFEVNRVKSVVDGSGFGDITSGLMSGSAFAAEDSASSKSLTLQPGENELSYSVTVTYYIK